MRAADKETGGGVGHTAMRINDPNASSISSAGLSQTQSVESTGRSRAKGLDAVGRSGGDHVELSGLSQQLSSLEGDSPERAALIQRLSLEVSNGTYRVSARELSASLLDRHIVDRT
jgi:anti-sigma28 factor (negative regulator of flagellin synthesis)